MEPAVAALIGAGVGSSASLAAQYLSHTYARSRERRTDLLKALDHAILNFVAADHTVMQMAMRIMTAQPDEVIQAHADRVSQHEAELRATVFSIRVRLASGSELVSAFSELFDALTASWRAAHEMLLLHPDDRPDSPQLRAWEEAHDAYRAMFDATMDILREALDSPRL